MGQKIRKLKKEEVSKYYEIQDRLGTGSFAVVKKAVRKKDGSEFAIKIVKKAKLSKEEMSVLHDEVKIMNHISHEHCVQLFEIFETNKKLYMVLELLTGGELFDRIVAKGSYSEKEAAELIEVCMNCLKYLHEQGIVHRDLKPENLIYLDPSDGALLKITDFGLAKMKPPGEKMTTACGTPGYVAPEVLKNEPYTNQVDIWSMGVILYILLCGFPPFYHDNTAALYKQIKKGEYDFPDPYWSDISDAAKDLVRKMLTVNPEKRYTADQVLAHPWISGGQAPDKPMDPHYAERLKMLQARRRLREAVQMVLAVNKLATNFKTAQAS